MRTSKSRFFVHDSLLSRTLAAPVISQRKLARKLSRARTAFVANPLPPEASAPPRPSRFEKGNPKRHKASGFVRIVQGGLPETNRRKH